MSNLQAVLCLVLVILLPLVTRALILNFGKLALLESNSGIDLPSPNFVLPAPDYETQDSIYQLRGCTPGTLEYTLETDKLGKLSQVVAKASTKTLIFIENKATCLSLAQQYKNSKRIVFIHGGQKSAQRNAALAKFETSKAPVLVTTYKEHCLTARSIDRIIFWDIPSDVDYGYFSKLASQPDGKITLWCPVGYRTINKNDKKQTQPQQYTNPSYLALTDDALSEDEFENLFG